MLSLCSRRTEMMEAKLWAALCALLLINLGSAEHDDGHSTVSNSLRSGGSEVAPNASTESAPIPDPTSHTVTSPNGTDTSLTSNVTSILSKETTTGSLTPEMKTDNGTNTVSPSEAGGPQNNITDQLKSQSSSPLPGTHAPTSLIPTKTPHTSTFADSLTQSNEPVQPKTNTFTSAPTSEPPKLETTTTTMTVHNNSAPSTSPSQETPKNSVSPSLTSPLNTLQPSGHPDTPSVAHQPSTILPASSPSAQSKAHVNTPSKLNVEGDTHKSPTLDPLLPGLVSAFIITAIIISLLLFLKLRRRDSRPEFRRLQDLPMDDMMEDTPLSMYSY